MCYAGNCVRVLQEGCCKQYVAVLGGYDCLGYCGWCDPASAPECDDANDPDPSVATPAPTPRPPATHAVSWGGDVSGGTLQVNAGDTVVWTLDQDAAAHSVTGATFDSQLLAPGQQFFYTFHVAGDFVYASSTNPTQTAVVYVRGTAFNRKQKNKRKRRRKEEEGKERGRTQRPRGPTVCIKKMKKKERKKEEGAKQTRRKRGRRSARVFSFSLVRCTCVEPMRSL